MEENARARDPEEQIAMTGQPAELFDEHPREGWPGPVRERCEPAREFGVVQGKVAGHRWDGWRRLAGDEGYLAACSCGWRSTQTGQVSPMLQQVTEHLDAVQDVRGGRPSARPAQAAGRDERERGRREVQPDERTRELFASVQSQQARLSQALEQSADLLSASQQQAERLVAVLEHAAAGVAPQWARTGAAVRREQGLQRQVERAKQWRDGLVAAAGALAAIAGEIALAGQDLQARYRSGSADDRRPPSEPVSRHGGGGVVADDVRLACGLGRAAD